MAIKTQIEKTILGREGFRVEFELFEKKPQALPRYDYSAMAPQRWKVSEWKNARLEPYRLLVKGVTIYCGDRTPIPRTPPSGSPGSIRAQSATKRVRGFAKFGPVRRLNTGTYSRKRSHKRGE